MQDHSTEHSRNPLSKILDRLKGHEPTEEELLKQNYLQDRELVLRGSLSADEFTERFLFGPHRPLAKRLLEKMLFESEAAQLPINLPKEFLDSVITGLNFALSNESAKAIDAFDLFHAHLCCEADSPYFSQPYSVGMIRELLQSNDWRLLYHSQEFWMPDEKDPSKRNLIQSPVDGMKVVLPTRKDAIAVTSADLGWREFPASLSFIAKPDGQHALVNGQTVSIVLSDKPLEHS